MAAYTYDPEVWFLLKAVWCAVPKISWPSLVEIVKEATNQPVPSPDSVRKKAKADKWVKRIRAYCQKADKTLDNIKCRLLDELREEYSKIQGDKAAKYMPALVGENTETGIPVFPEKILENIAYKNRTTVNVLQEHRRRTGKVGQLLDDSMDWMYEAKETLFKLNLPDEEVREDQLDKARQQFALLEAMVEKIESFSRTSKNLMQMDFLLFGINTDDTRDSDTKDRMSAIKDDSVFDQARKDLDEQYKIMQQQASWIQNGHFENEVIKEMEEQMRREEAEDAEFMEVNDDDDD